MYKKIFLAPRIITNLHPGAVRSWRRLLEGHCGVVSLKESSLEFDGIPSQVAALVPTGDGVEGGWIQADWLVAGVLQPWGVGERELQMLI